MNESIRLYFESVVRLAIGESPSNMSNEQLLGVFGLLPDPTVNFTQWTEKLGMGSAPNDHGPSLNDVHHDFDERIKVLRK